MVFQFQNGCSGRREELAKVLEKVAVIGLSATGVHHFSPGRRQEERMKHLPAGKSCLGFFSASRRTAAHYWEEMGLAHATPVGAGKTDATPVEVGGALVTKADRTNMEAVETVDAFLGKKIMLLVLHWPPPEKNDDAEDYWGKNPGRKTKKLLAQKYLSDIGVLEFENLDEPSACRGKDGFGVEGKWVFVPGLGNDLCLSPTGVDKGSAVRALLRSFSQNRGGALRNDQLAVFGDAQNDVELFGTTMTVPSSNNGNTLEDGTAYRPAVRVAMPDAAAMLKSDATEIAMVSAVLEKIIEARKMG